MHSQQDWRPVQLNVHLGPGWRGRVTFYRLQRRVLLPGLDNPPWEVSARCLWLVVFVISANHIFNAVQPGPIQLLEYQIWLILPPVTQYAFDGSKNHNIRAWRTWSWVSSGWENVKWLLHPCMFLTWTIRTAGPSAFSTSTCLSSWSSPPPPNTPVLTGGNKILSKKFKPPSPHILEEYIYIYIHNMQFTNTFGQSCLLSLQVKPPFHFLSDAFQWMSRSSKIKTSEASQNIFFFDYF